MKKAIFAFAIAAMTLASCGTNEPTENTTLTTDSTSVQVDTCKADSTCTDTTIVK